MACDLKNKQILYCVPKELDFPLKKLVLTYTT